MADYFVRVFAPGGEVETTRFTTSPFTIGRARSNDLVLDDRSVSDEHARIITRPAGLFVEDLESAAGTLVDGKPIPATFLVREPHPIQIGSYTIELYDRPPPTSEERRFLSMLEADPRDDDTRRVFGDWLEEHGQTDKAEMLRAQLALVGLLPEDPRFHELSSRVEALAKELPLDWRRTVARPPIEKCEVRFELVCPKRWDALAPTASPRERYCDACKKNVHYAPTVFEAQRLALLGHCIAVDVAQKRSPNDLDPRPPPTAGMPVPLPPTSPTRG